jgi:hypothetical protein
MSKRNPQKQLDDYIHVHYVLCSLEEEADGVAPRPEEELWDLMKLMSDRSLSPGVRRTLRRRFLGLYRTLQPRKASNTTATRTLEFMMAAIHVEEAKADGASPDDAYAEANAKQPNVTIAELERAYEGQRDRRQKEIKWARMIIDMGVHKHLIG